jgi:hypothetical protein
MRIRILLFVMVISVTSRLHADEGMWLPFLLDESLLEEMQEMGLEITPEQLFSFTGSSLKDAIVSFGGFCTGEMISDKGLVLTNHHCGYGRIQAHSSVENDILTDGFWAKSLSEELPNPGLYVRFLVSATDVTEQIEAALNPKMSTGERSRTIMVKGRQLAAEATRGTHYSANVRPFFAGNAFFLFVYETFDDVRLVGTPPSDIGKYGGDTDNWMWPRHTGDFALFRVYTAPDGTPAEYSPDNIPLKPRHHLPISLQGVKEDDFAMILGYPGSTERYLTSHGIDFRLENVYPVRIDIRRKKLDILDEAMHNDNAIRIMYASTHAGIANYWKNFIGMSEALQKHRVADTKRELETAFAEWIALDPARKKEYGEVMKNYELAYEGLRQFHSHNIIFAETVASGPDIMSLANNFSSLLNILEENGSAEAIENEVERLKVSAYRTYRDYDQNVDQQMWAAMFEKYHTLIPEDMQPAIFNEITTVFAGDFDGYAAYVYSNSVFANQESMEAFLNAPEAATLKEDPAFLAAVALYDHNRTINQQISPHNARLNEADRLFQKGLMEMNPESLFYSDANSTMRFTYGKVKGYYPADAVYYHYKTTLHGVMEKENPDHHEFIVPDRLKELYEADYYGIYGENGSLVVNFITDHDITGGNSGSPVINAKGHLIGLAFDGNWEAMSGDILFEPELQRCINVDARYILFIIDKFAGASHLLDEMTIILP